MKPYEVERALEKCSLISEWKRDETLKRWRWAIDSYIDGYVPESRMRREQSRFLREAERLIAEDSFQYVLTRPAPKPTPESRRRHKEWLRAEAARATKLELQRQRKRLREGHATLTAIRRLLARGVPRSLGTESGLATSSPTS